MGSGGPSKVQTDAAAANLQLAKTAGSESAAKIAREGDQYAIAKPEILNRLQFGNPHTGFFLDAAGGPIAQGYQPIYQAAARGHGDGPSGSYDANLRAIRAQQARDYANAQMGILNNDQATRDQALGMLTGQQQIALNSGQGMLNSGISANQGILSSQALMNQGSPIMGIVGGMASAALGNTSNKVPF